MLVLGIETTCDETAAAVIERQPDGSGKILSNIVHSQIDDHAPYGGVVPEIAARAHIDLLDGIVGRAMKDADVNFAQLTGVAAAAGPGLIGGVIVGLTTAKAIAMVHDTPLVAVNHLEAHALTPRLTCPLAFPYCLFLASGGHTQIVAVLGVGCAYVLARYRNVWVDVGLFLILMLQVLPASLMVTPIFVGFSQFGLLDTPRLAVILAIAAKSMPFFVVLVRATFMSVPMELEEAALVDGNSRIGAFFNIVLPLARNGILVSAILIFMQAFGEFVYSKSLIQAVELQPASVGLNSFMGPNTNEWNNIMAYATIYVTPILAAFVLLQRRIVSGLTSGALK